MTTSACFIARYINNEAFVYELIEMENRQRDEEEQQQRDWQGREEEQGIQKKITNDKDFNDTKNKEIGKTIASDKYPNTIDGFWFSLAPNLTYTHV
jgi:hypothetical protein